MTTALVQFIDKERPEGTMCCSNTECAYLESAFLVENFIYIEDFIQKKLLKLSEFESSLCQVLVEALSGEMPTSSNGSMSWAVAINDDEIKKLAPKILALAKKELLSYADESNPAIEAMADLERTFECNPDKLPGWLKNELDRIRLEAHTKGYNKGYKDAEKQYNESVAYHFPTMPTPPSGWGCDGTHCTNPHHDCINCPVKYSSGGTITTPNTASGTSTATLHGNTSATDGKEHNPSFTD